MSARGTRWILIAGGIAAAVVLFLVLRPSDDEDAATTTTTTTATTATTVAEETAPPAETATEPPTPTIEVTVRDGVPVGGIARASVEKGDRVTIAVKSDAADEVHVHGYDLVVAAPAGKHAELSFTASIAGEFEIELEDAGLPIAELQVQP